jgi:xanthine dehydrogenase YagS FAD-binding subunit
VLGGVAPVPWRVPKAETFLVGKLPDENTLREAAKIALEGAQPLSKNGYKVPLAQTLVRRALAKVSGNATS